MDIKEIVARPIVGNAYSDMDLMNDIHEFVMEDNEVADKIKALTKLDEVMGEVNPQPVTLADVLSYVNDYIN